ncbi:MAG: HutP, partial [Halanaerobiaceae bacterium]
MNISDFRMADFIRIEGEQSLGKVATLLAIVDDRYDEDLMESFRREGYRPVITRAGGKGEQ